jgi:hypothetical protein
MNVRSRLPVVLLVALAVLPTALRAEHEANHRYTMHGYVLDAQRRALADVPVSVYLEDRLVGGARTATDGSYNIRMHLHDADIGRTLRVRAGGHTAQVRMHGTPGDRSTERVHPVNFVGAALVEYELDRGGVPAWLYAAGGLVLATGALVTVQRLRRRSKRRALAAR